MAQLLVRNLEDDVKKKIESRAQRHGHSMAEEVREILRNAVRREHASAEPLGSCVTRRFADIGLDEEIPELRGQAPRAVDFDG